MLEDPSDPGRDPGPAREEERDGPAQLVDSHPPLRPATCVPLAEAAGLPTIASKLRWHGEGRRIAFLKTLPARDVDPSAAQPRTNQSSEEVGQKAQSLPALDAEATKYWEGLPQARRDELTTLLFDDLIRAIWQHPESRDLAAACLASVAASSLKDPARIADFYHCHLAAGDTPSCMRCQLQATLADPAQLFSPPVCLPWDFHFPLTINPAQVDAFMRTKLDSLWRKILTPSKQQTKSKPQDSTQEETDGKSEDPDDKNNKEAELPTLDDYLRLFAGVQLVLHRESVMRRYPSAATSTDAAVLAYFHDKTQPHFEAALEMPNAGTLREALSEVASVCQLVQHCWEQHTRISTIRTKVRVAHAALKEVRSMRKALAGEQGAPADTASADVIDQQVSSLPAYWLDEAATLAAQAVDQHAQAAEDFLRNTGWPMAKLVAFSKEFCSFFMHDDTVKYTTALLDLEAATFELQYAYLDHFGQDCAQLKGSCAALEVQIAQLEAALERCKAERQAGPLTPARRMQVVAQEQALRKQQKALQQRLVHESASVAFLEDQADKVAKHRAAMDTQRATWQAHRAILLEFQNLSFQSWFLPHGAAFLSQAKGELSVEEQSLIWTCVKVACAVVYTIKSLHLDRKWARLNPDKLSPLAATAIHAHQKRCVQASTWSQAHMKQLQATAQDVFTNMLDPARHALMDTCRLQLQGEFCAPIKQLVRERIQAAAAAEAGACPAKDAAPALAAEGSAADLAPTTPDNTPATTPAKVGEAASSLAASEAGAAGPSKAKVKKDKKKARKKAQAAAGSTAAGAHTIYMALVSGLMIGLKSTQHLMAAADGGLNMQQLAVMLRMNDAAAPGGSRSRARHQHGYQDSDSYSNASWSEEQYNMPPRAGNRRSRDYYPAPASSNGSYAEDHPPQRGGRGGAQLPGRSRAAYYEAPSGGRYREAYSEPLDSNAVWPEERGAARSSSRRLAGWPAEEQPVPRGSRRYGENDGVPWDSSAVLPEAPAAPRGRRHAEYAGDRKNGVAWHEDAHHSRVSRSASAAGQYGSGAAGPQMESARARYSPEHARSCSGSGEHSAPHMTRAGVLDHSFISEPAAKPAAAPLAELDPWLDAADKADQEAEEAHAKRTEVVAVKPPAKSRSTAGSEQPERSPASELQPHVVESVIQLAAQRSRAPQEVQPKMGKSGSPPPPANEADPWLEAAVQAAREAEEAYAKRTEATDGTAVHKRSSAGCSSDPSIFAHCGASTAAPAISSAGKHAAASLTRERGTAAGASRLGGQHITCTAPIPAHHNLTASHSAGYSPDGP
ncbi:hypothetical protein WJX72_012166 [[Myrmecia] bisecta]|uniref:Uncharacterized protein n=1 Tax=[Myrmecia] bisecta TaxID=41462 RepID=A0AAW1PEM6_9CHLO